MGTPQPTGDQSGQQPAGPAAFLRNHLARNRDVVLALGVRGMAVLAAFAVTYIIGHEFGAAATGQYALVTQTAMFLAIVGLIGLDVSVVRHFAKAVANKARIALASLLRVLGAGFGMMAVIAVILWLGGEWVWQTLFGDTVPTALLPVLCLLLIGRGGVQLLGGLLRSQHRFTLGQGIAALAIPGVTALTLILGIANSVEDALWVSAFAGLLAVAVGLIAMIPHVSRKPGALDIRLAVVLASSLPLWGAGLAQVIGDWYGLAVAAQVFGASEAGLFRVSVQIAAVLQIVSSALQSVYSAKISTAFHAENRQLAAQIARSSVRFSTVLAIPIVVIILAGGELLLEQIGPEFSAAMPILIVMVIGQLLLTLSGPCGMVLAMSGNERVNLAISLISVTLLLVLVPLAALQGGLIGMAICIATVLTFRNLLAYAYLRYRVGISVWSGRVFESAAGI